MSISSQRRQSFEGFGSPTYTMVPDELFDELVTDLSGAELKALLYIIRRTFGFKKDSDSISFNQFLTGIVTRDGRRLDRGCGIKSRSHLSTALKNLEALGAIASQKSWDDRGENQTTVYKLRFRSGGVVPKSNYPGAEIELPVVPKSHPQQTDLQETVEQDVVVIAREALKEFGLSDAVAAELAAAYPEAYILAKLDLVRWLQDNNSALVSKNPAGYLRRAIEQDYVPPPRYQTPEQRRAAAEAKEAALTAEQEERRQAELEYAEEKAQQEQQLRELYPPQPVPGTDRTTTEIWDETLELMRAQVIGLAFDMFIKNSVLTQCDAGHATIVASSGWNAERLATRHDPLIRQTLSHVLGQPVRCTYVSRSEALTTADDPPLSALPPREGEPRLLNV